MNKITRKKPNYIKIRFTKYLYGIINFRKYSRLLQYPYDLIISSRGSGKKYVMKEVKK